MPVQDFLVAPKSAPVTVALEPAQNAFHSLLLLLKGQHASGLGDWVTQTANALSPAERQRHELIIIGLHYAVLPDQSWPSFPAYLEYLASCNPDTLRDKMLATYARVPPLAEGKHQPLDPEPASVDWPAVLENVDTYLDFLRARFQDFDEEREAEAYAYIVDPPAMQELIVAHLRTLWEEYLAPEWQRVEPMLQDAVKAFQQVDYSGMSKLEAIGSITDQDLEAEQWNPLLEQAEQIVLVPSAHVGPYLGKLWAGDALWIFFGARLPSGVQYHAPDLSRTELVVRLNALADENRLRILKLVADVGELPSPEIMARLDLSQSAASRHLTQLSASGYLKERRCDGAKCYTLNPERVRDTLQALSVFLLKS